MAGYRNHPVTDYESVIDRDTQFIDVREADEVAAGSISGTMNIPLGDLELRLNELEQNRRVVLVCRSGTRSGSAAELLVSAGFSDVVHLEGGMLAYNLEDNA